MDTKLQQLKGIYSASTGICAAFFLALLSSDVKLGESTFLFLSSLCFGVLMPILAAFLTALLLCTEKKFSSKATLSALNKNWVDRIGSISGRLFVLAFVFLLCHFSLFIGISMFLVSIMSYLGARRFLISAKQLDQMYRSEPNKEPHQ